MKTRMIWITALLLILPTLSLAQEEAPTQVLFENVRVFDGKSDELSKPTSVLVENNLIKAIDSSAGAGAQAVRIDGDGRTLMPGLIDSHVHLNLTGLFFSFDQAEFARWDAVGAMATTATQIGGRSVQVHVARPEHLGPGRGAEIGGKNEARRHHPQQGHRSAIDLDGAPHHRPIPSPAT